MILAEPDIAFSADRLVPALAGWREDRFLSPSRGPYTVAPDWVCEILSPASVQTDRVRKLPIYSAHHALTDALACGELLQAQAATHYPAHTPVGALWS